METYCLVCGKEIKKERGRHAKKLCSMKCSGIWRSAQRPIKYVERECLNCHKVFKADNSQVKLGYYKLCSNKCRFEYTRGENSHFFKGGWIRPDGYRQISIDGKMYLEHRYVMEKHLGRNLERNEHVHHKNENKLDNDLENLEMISASIHTRDHGIGRKSKPTSIERMRENAKNRKRNERGVFIKN